MGAKDVGSTWLGMKASDSEGNWSLPVSQGVISGASALFGGCATAAAIVAAQQLAPQPILWASAHFGSLAKLGTIVELSHRTISAGRTMTHAEIVGRVDDRESFTVRVAAGQRPDHSNEGTWATPPPVEPPQNCPPFLHPVHANTWAERFEWRLGGSRTDATGPWAAWWIRPTAEALDPIVPLAVLADYVTYGVGRALNAPMGGLSIDNVLRLHQPSAAAGVEWLLLEVRPEGIAGGFGHGASRIFADGILAASGSQSMVMNNWDWRLPGE